MKALIIIAVLVFLLLLAGLLWLGLRSGGVRRREFQRISRELDLANVAIEQIESKASLYKDVDSVIATEVRTAVETYRQEVRNNKKERKTLN